MSESTITGKGQTTVRADIRQAIGADAGTRLGLVSPLDGRPFVRVKNKSVLDMKGMASKAAGAKLLKT